MPPCVPGLPAGFVWLARRFAIILVRKPFAAAVAARRPKANRRPTTLRLGDCFIHPEGTPANFFTIEGGDGLGRPIVIRHFYKSEAAGPPSLSIHGYVNTCDLPKRLE